MTIALDVSGLSFAYPEGGKVLKELNFSVEAGETVAVLGLSGCGKTTLCHCLCGIIPHVVKGKMSGVIRVNGQDTVPRSLAQLATEIGMVFQNPDNQLVATTVEDELAFAPENLCLPPGEIFLRVEEIIKQFSLDELRLRNPNRLSGGEKQLVAMGAVLALKPSILVLDEPMSRLDQRGRRIVREALRELGRKGHTLIIVEHDLSLVEFADRWLVLENGCLIRVDTPRNIIADEFFCREYKLIVP